MTAKHGLLKHPDGSHRLLYSMEAPESWAEDFGTGTLANGKADVRLDPDFAAVVETGEYHIFLTPYGSLGALRVGTRRGDGFTVEEIGGANNGTFSYRIAARPRSEKKTVRLAKYAVPVPLHMPTADALNPPAARLPPPAPKKP
jgi:hypothetical protein